MHFIIKLFNPSGIEGAYFLGSIGSDWICFNAIVTGDSASKGSIPVTISYKTIPKE